MSRTAERLLIVASSGRALGESARRGGYRPVVLDAFADADTQACAERCVPMGDAMLDASALERTIRACLTATSTSGVVYGAALEAWPALVETLARETRVYGNAGDVLRVLADPARLSRLLGELRIPHPQTRRRPPAGPPSRWLVKRGGAHGGGHVRVWDGAQPRPRGCYFQRRVAGPVLSVPFLADGGRARVLGYNTLSARPTPAAPPFGYSGAINRAPLAAAQRARIEGWIHRLVRHLGLRGLNGLDLVLGSDGPVLLEVNPRASATFELYEPEAPGGLVGAHIEACAGTLPSSTPPASPVRAHAVLYAPMRLSIPPHRRWPAWCRDRPAAGTVVAPGEPLCSVFAEGARVRAVRQSVTARREQVLGELCPGSAAA